MPTLMVLPTTTVIDKFRQSTDQVTDADGYKELALYCNVSNLTNGGSTLTVELVHAARNENEDYFALWSETFTTAETTVAYIDNFARYLRTKVSWATGNSTTTADVELLVVPKHS